MAAVAASIVQEEATEDQEAEGGGAHEGGLSRAEGGTPEVG